MTALTDNRLLGRFELDLGDALAFIDYRTIDGVLWLTHAEVPASHQGQGVAATLTAQVLAAARLRGVKVRPICSYVRAYMDRHPEVQDLRA